MSVIRRHLPLVLAVLLVLPGAAHAASTDFGSELSSPANAVESHPVDTVYWDPGAPSPVTGQLRYVTIRGGVLPGGGNGAFRFVVLRANAMGAVKVVALDDRDLTLPVTEDPMRRVPNKGFNWKLCLREGDRLGIWKKGHGTLRIFADAPDSVTSWYENAAGVASGNVFTGTASPARELLMQVLVTSGPDAFSRCPGGYKDHVYRNLDVHRARLGGRHVAVRASCPRETYGRCTGRLTLRSGDTTFGSAPFDVPYGGRVTLRVPVSAAHAALLRRRGSMAGRAVMRGHDDPTDPRNTRAPAPRPGVQRVTNEDRVTLRG
jgi:hypothetical protein